MGMAWFDGGDIHQAVKCFDKALKRNPDFYKGSEVVSMNLGNVYLNVRRTEDALPFFQNALRLNPDNREAAQKAETVSHALA